jgi:large subunit ribosomal protein L24
MKIKKGDKVKVLNGKDKGKISNVVSVIRATNKVIVAGVNMVTIFEKKQKDTNKGGISKIEAPINVSKVQFVDEDNKASRIGYEMKDGKKVRVHKKSKKQLN